MESDLLCILAGAFAGLIIYEIAWRGWDGE